MWQGSLRICPDGTTTLLAALDITTGNGPPSASRATGIGSSRLSQAHRPSRAPRPQCPSCHRQLCHSQACQGAPLAGPAAPLPRPLHAHAFLVAAPAGSMVRVDRETGDSSRQPPQRPRSHRPNQAFVAHDNRSCRPFAWIATADSSPETRQIMLSYFRESTLKARRKT